MATVCSGCSTSCGSFGRQLPLRGRRGGDATRFRLRNGGRRDDASIQVQVKAINPTNVTAEGCVCKAAACALEFEVAGVAVWGGDDEMHGTDDFDGGKMRGLRRRSVQPPAVVEGRDVSFRNASSAPASQRESKSEYVESMLHFLGDDGSRLHFLEELNEETLSKRMMKLSQSNKVRSATELFDFNAGVRTPTKPSCLQLPFGLLCTSKFFGGCDEDV
jgi:hypothetical protein